jgi:hypothetical protein
LLTVVPVVIVGATVVPRLGTCEGWRRSSSTCIVASRGSRVETWRPSFAHTLSYFLGFIKSLSKFWIGDCLESLVDQLELFLLFCLEVIGYLVGVTPDDEFLPC